MAGRGIGNRHRTRAALTVLAALVVVVAGACNESRSGTTVERAGDGADVTIAAEPTVGSTASPQVELPPLDPDVADQVATQLADPELAMWLALAVSTLPDPDRPCPVTVTPLPDDAVATVVALADDMLGELLVNLDGALGGLELACDNGDSQAASLEAADVVALVTATQQRLEEIER